MEDPTKTAEVSLQEKIDQLQKTVDTMQARTKASLVFEALLSGNPEEVRKALNEASNLKVRESLSTVVETVANNETPILNALKGRSKTVYNTLHEWVADYDNASDNSFGPIDEDLSSTASTDLTRTPYTASIRFYRRLNKVGIVEQSKQTPNGVPILEANRVHHVKRIMKDLDKHIIEGNSAVIANQLDGLIKFQDTNGHADLTIDAQGAPISLEMIEEALAKGYELGGGSTTDMFMGTEDSIDLQLLLQRRNVSDGTLRTRFEKYPSTQSPADPNIVVDVQPDSLRKVKATATHGSGALQFTGAVANDDLVVIGGVTYTAKAAANASLNYFASGTAAVAMASLIAIINDGLPAGANTDTVKATAVGTTGANFTARRAGAAGNAYTVVKTTGANITVNTANFTGGLNSTLLLYNMPMITLCEYEFAGVAGIGTFPAVETTLTASKELITWLGCLEVDNPRALARIINLG